MPPLVAVRAKESASDIDKVKALTIASGIDFDQLASVGIKQMYTDASEIHVRERDEALGDLTFVMREQEKPESEHDLERMQTLCTKYGQLDVSKVAAAVAARITMHDNSIKRFRDASQLRDTILEDSKNADDSKP